MSLKKKKLDWWSGGQSSPTVQASNFAVVSSSDGSVDVSLTKGNGLLTVVVAKQNGYVDSNPVSGVSYVANAFGLGSQIGSGNYVVYIGTASSFTITGLPAGLIFLRAYAANGNQYNTDRNDTNCISVLNMTTEVAAQVNYGVAQAYQIPPVWNIMRDDYFLRALGAELAKVDQLVIYNTYGDSNYSLINLMAPGTRNHQVVLNGGSMSFTKGSGHLPSSNAYIRTNFIPATHGVNMTTNNTGLVFYTPTNSTASGTAGFNGSGGSSLANAIGVSLRFTGDLIVVRVNAATSASAANATTSGLYQLKRTASNAFVVFKELVQIVTSAVIATGLSTIEIIIDGFNNNGTPGSFDTKLIGGAYLIGSSFDQTVVKSAHDGLLSFNTQVSIEPVTTFPDYTNTTNDLDQFLASVEEAKLNFSVANPGNITNPTYSLFSEYLAGNTPTGAGGTHFQVAVNLPNDKILFVPSDAQQGVVLDTTNDTFITFGSFAATTQKWSGGYYHSATGLIFCCPYQSNTWMVIDTNNSYSTKFYDTTGEVAEGAGNLTGTEKWFMVKEGSDGWMWAFPYNATVACRMHPVTKQIQFLDTTGLVGSISGNLTGTAKWDSGCAFEDKMIGSISSTTNILVINCHPTAPTCSRVDNTFPGGTNEYGLAHVGWDGTDSFVYIWPYHNTQIIKFNPRTNTHTFIGDATYFTGGTAIKAACLGYLPNGKILATGRAGYATIFDPVTNELTKITDALLDGSHDWVGSTMNSKGHIYNAPTQGTKILKQYIKNMNFEVSDNFAFSRYSHSQ